MDHDAGEGRRQEVDNQGVEAACGSKRNVANSRVTCPATGALCPLLALVASPQPLRESIHVSQLGCAHSSQQPPIQQHWLTGG